MADNVITNSGAGGPTFATDDIGGVHYPINKMAIGALDSQTLLSGGNGTTDAGTIRVTVSSDTTGVLSVDDNGGSLTVDATALDIRALTNADVITAELSATDNAVLDTIATPVATISATPLQRVAIFDASDTQITSFGGGTQYAVDVALGATPTGTLAVAIRDDALSTLTPIEGDAVGLRVDADGALWVIPSGTTTVSATALDIRALTNSDIVTAELSATDNAVLDTIETNTDFGTVVGGGTEATALRVTIASDSTGVVTVDGTITANAGTGTFTVDGSGVTQPISAASLPLPTGAATEATLATIDTDTGNIAAGYAAEGAALGSGVLIQGDDGTDRTNVLVDTDGHLQVDILSGGGGDVQYTEGATDATITGTALIWEDAADTLVVASAAKPLPVSVTGGGDATAANQTTIIGHVDGIEALLTTIDTDTSTLATVDYATQTTLSAINAKLVTGTIIGAVEQSGTWTVDLGATDNAVLDNIVTNTTGLNNAVGTDGAVGPANAISIGGTESGGNFQEVRVDTDGHLQVDVLSGGGSGPTDVDDDAVASGQSPALGISMAYMYDGTDWSRAASGTGVRTLQTQRVTIATDDVVPASQSGTWNITNVSGTVSLPTGAATEATLGTIDTDTGNIAAGYAVEGAALGSGVLIQGDDGVDRTNVLVDTDGHLQVDILSGGGGGTQDTEDDAIAAGQTVGINVAMAYLYDGVDWSRAAAGTGVVNAQTQRVTIATDDTVTVDATALDIRALLNTDVVTAELSATDNAVLDSIDTNTTGLNNVIGTDGTAGPTSVISVGGTESGGNIQEFRVDADGHLQVDILSGGGGTPNVISTNNSTTTPLGISGNFTGTADDVSAYAAVSIQIDSDVNSATDGMTFEFSSDNTNWDDVYTFNYTTSEGARRFQFPVTAQYFRINYTNGGTGQAHFRVQTILHSEPIRTSIHRVEDNVSPDRSVELVKAVLAAQVNGSGDFVPIQSSAGGVLKIGGTVEVDTWTAGTLTVTATALDIRALTNLDVVTAELSAVDNAVLDAIETNTDFGAVQGGGTEATALRVTIANDSTGVLSIDDNGASLTVDATALDIRALTNTDVVTAELSATDNAVLDSIDTNTTGLNTTVGTDGAAGPAGALSVGGTEAGGNFQEVRVDTDGHLQVDVLSGGGSGPTDVDDDAVAAGQSPALNIAMAYMYDGTDWSRAASGTGVRTLQTQRVTIATDDVVPASQSGTWNITNVSGTVSLPTGAATETTLATVETNTDFGTVTGGGTEAGALRVTIANNSTGTLTVDNGGTFATQVDGAALTALQLIDDTVVTHGVAASSTTDQISLEGRSTEQTAVDNGDAVRALATLLGKLVTVPYAIPASTWSYATATLGVTDTADDAAKTAAGAGIRNYVTSVQVINGHATVATEVVIKDGSTVLWRGWAEAVGGGVSAKFDPPLRGTANTAINVANITTGSKTYFNLQGFEAAE